MDHFKTIYRSRAADYDRLVAREDHEHNLIKALRDIRPLGGLDVIELGAGTGRLTRLLAPHVASVCAFDISAHMLGTARDRLRAAGAGNWALAIADNRALPAAGGAADIAVEGWSIGHLAGWYPGTWRAEVDRALKEMRRVVKPGGVVIVIETLGTGQETPSPGDALAALFARLEGVHGFASTWIRTDYRFESLDEAEALTRFFFGDALADRVVRENRVILPECTGIWWLNV
ncbi:MAG: methyltransferase domain-containing protein [Anaerolineae bacterium]|nr:methyltransferase domain-containing protein [Anaerolineae bacterium]